MFKTEDEFDKNISDNWGKKHVYLDGISDIEKYKNRKETKIRILWILKEPNGDKNDKEEIFRQFHKEGVTDYGRWKCTYKRIMLVTYMLLGGLNKIPDIDIIKNKNPLRNIAIININKNGGGSTSSKSKLIEQYNKNKDILLEQVKGIDPDIIINCSMVDEFYNDLRDKYINFKEKSYIDDNNREIGYAYKQEKLLINYYHPNCHSKGMTDEWYCENILKIYNKWQKLINKLST